MEQLLSAMGYPLPPHDLPPVQLITELAVMNRTAAEAAAIAVAAAVRPALPSERQQRAEAPCDLDVRVITEDPTHRDALRLQQIFAPLEMDLHLADNAEMRGRAAFDSMALADVLIAASSGFSRLAAVLSRGAGMAPFLTSHPMHLPSVVEVQPHKQFWQETDNDKGLASLLRGELAKHSLVSEVRRLLAGFFPECVPTRPLHL